MSNELYIVLDESGAMHDKNDYFIIGGYVTSNLHQVISKCKKVEQEIRNNNSNYYKNIQEINGFNIKPQDIAQYIKFVLKSVQTLIPISIVINKNELKKKKWIENSAFNIVHLIILLNV